MNMPAPFFSIIVPVYNRPAEVSDLCESLLAQTDTDFELVIVEDGSTVDCRAVVENACRRGLRAEYFYKGNEGRSIARNYGLERARGSYFLFFDSDCVIPPAYIATLKEELRERPLDCFGGIRGGKVQLEKFTPRTFNMGYSRRVYERVGGFREMFSEDIDMSTRIRRDGFSIGLVRPAFVWHKRRVDFRRFFRQVYVFGMSRITLKLLYPDSLKVVHLLPAVFVAGTVALLLLGIFVSPWCLLPLGAYFAAIFVCALAATRSLRIAFLAVPAAVIQLGGYGLGFIKAFVSKILLRRGRNVEEEIEIRRGK